MSKVDMPLTAIRALVAVGRQGTFTRAASALGITQSAVSHHVATLETLAGVPLFERKGSSILFTPAGMQFYDAVKDAIATIELATQQLAQRGGLHDRLRVRTSMPSFSMAVVVPQLGAYTARQQVQIDLITSLSPPQPHDDFDVLITRDLSLPGTESWELLRETLVCVGSPTLVAAHQSRPVPSWPMIAARSRPDLISTWAIAHEVPADRLQVTARYDHLFLAIAAAVGSAGLLVVPHLLVRDPLQSGALQLAAPGAIDSGASYVAYVHARSQHAEIARDFCRWLKRAIRDGQ
ncbi:LysR family transcriptional regulator [Pelomonas sp. CA6]|uniref:LysR family transcriptional regulator n=1 Tax=Pelomonas sp. CA6 TaxID=2907999 RepID=UPI001F4B92E3|nr:LysR family transcriptional regulator [Pelomonas sp. CA6]MCH7342328.1 LysR family transcriptional regulator [Pelomonas sp. CA6]